MNWKEDEKVVEAACQELQFNLNLYTPNDIDEHCDEAEFHRELGAIKDGCRGVDKGIRELLRDHGDSMPTQQKDYWTNQAAEILRLVKSHERQLRAALTRAKGNITAPASNASELARGKRKEALSKMKTNEESIDSDVSKLQEKIYRVRDWTLEDDVSIGRGLKMSEKWDKDLEKIVQMMRELKTLQRVHDVEETEIEVERLKKLVGELEEDVEEVKEKIAKEDNERELYSLDPVKVSKVNLPTFSGEDHEDFSKFKEDMEKGFKTNRITRDEQIIKLRECLEGYARKLVPNSNVIEIKEAWRILKQAFGNPIKIINQRKKALMKLGMKSRNTSNLSTEIAWYIDMTTFLREIIDLGIKNPDYSELIFSHQFAVDIRQLFPPNSKWRTKLRRCKGQGQSHLENMLELIGEWLEAAQIEQQENDIATKNTNAPTLCSSDDNEEDFVDSQDSSVSGSPHENITQQVGGASLIFAHFMPSFEPYNDSGSPSITNSVISHDDELPKDDLQEDPNDIQASSIGECDNQSDIEETNEVHDDYDDTIWENDDQLNVHENDDQSNPGIENNDQFQFEEQVNWVGAITSSNTRQCRDTSQTLLSENDDQ